MKRGRDIFSFIILIVSLTSFISADVSSEIQKLTHYAEEYEMGNIDYARLIVYSGAVREQLNENVGVIDRNEGGIMSEEQVRKALGEPTEKTKWVWSEEENKKLDESIPAWRKLIFDGKKIQIHVEAFPSLYKKGYRDEEGNFFPDEDAREEIVYRIHFNIHFKQLQEEINLNEKIEGIKKLAEVYFFDQSDDNGENLAKEMVSVENAFRSSTEGNQINCDQTMTNLFGSENRRSDQVIIVQRINLFDGDDFEVILDSEMCDECDYHWIGFNFHTEHRGKFEEHQPVDVPSGQFRGLSNEQYKKEISENINLLKSAYSENDFATAEKIIARLRALQEGWNEKSNNVWEEINKKYEPLQRNPPENNDRYYWIKIEKEKREEIRSLMDSNHEERKKFYNEIFSGYEKEEFVYSQTQWEKRLFEQFKERGEEICDNNIDDNQNGQVDCDEDQCSGKFAGEETLIVGEGEMVEEKIVQLYCISGERKQKEVISEPEPACGNHKCDENEYADASQIPALLDAELEAWKLENLLCPEDCSLCPEYGAIECNGKIMFKGQDAQGCKLEPYCLEEKSCTNDDDCQFRCGEGRCNEEKKCEIKELTECREEECVQGQETLQNCADGTQLIIKICNDGLWTDTGLKCPQLPVESENENEEEDTETDEESEDSITDEESDEAIEESVEVIEKIIGEACSVKEDCGNNNDVCSNGICVTIPETLTEEEIPDINLDENPERIKEIQEGESREKIKSEVDQGISGNFIFNFIRGLFRKASITGRVTGYDVEGSEENGSDNTKDSGTNSENTESTDVPENSEQSDFEQQNSDEERRNREDNERRDRENRENEEREQRDSEERNRRCDENCGRECGDIIHNCVQKCVFGENGDESNDLELCKRTCEEEKKAETDVCFSSCKEKCLNGEEFNEERKEEEHKEELAVFTVGGSCRSSEDKKEAGIHFGGWGKPFGDLHLIKDKYYRDNKEWCKQDIENLVRQRIEFENNFNEEFARWFLDDYLANSAENWGQHVSGIYDLYWNNVDIQRQLAERMGCLGKRDVTEIFQPKLIEFEYETERGRIKYWETIERAKIHDDAEEGLIITPRMEIWIFPEESFIKTEMKRAMKAHEFPGGNDENGPPEEEKKMMRQHEELMNIVREVEDKYGGKVAVQIRDSDNDETIFNVLLTINEKEIFSIEPMLPEETPEHGADIILDSDDIFSLVEKTEKDMRGGHTERPPWDKSPRVKETINEVVDGISVYFKIRALINNAEIVPVSEEKNVKKLAKKFLRLAITQGGGSERGEPNTKELDQDIFERDAITGEAIYDKI